MLINTKKNGHAIILSYLCTVFDDWRQKNRTLTYEKIIFQDFGVTAELSTFMTKDGITEQHAILHVEPRGDLFAGQFQHLQQAEEALLHNEACAGSQVVFKRYFLSDATNQAPSLIPHPSSLSPHPFPTLPFRGLGGSSAVSYIQQPPLDGSKVAVWLYLVQGMDIEDHDGLVIARHNGYEHLWKMGMCVPEGDSAQQTTTLLKQYEDLLQRHGATLADNCIRTWFYVRDVDTQYAGMVRARRENFQEQGLTENTHFIASTGIGGSPADTKALVQLGTYALMGFAPEQQRYLYAKTHLNPTYEYGVTFERGTTISYGDRSHVFISGTASINNKGEVVHVGDIVKQTHRMWENVEALLKEADASFDDVAQIIVYLRDTGDYDVVKELFASRFPGIPCVITLAPVCRPTWLIEMECLAIKAVRNPLFKAF